MAAGAVKKVHQRTIDSFYTQRIFAYSRLVITILFSHCPVQATGLTGYAVVQNAREVRTYVRSAWQLNSAAGRTLFIAST